MIVYLLMLGISLIFAFLSIKKGRKQKMIFQMLSSLPFIVVSAIRYGVGTDYLFRYVPDYLIIYEGANVPNLELVIKLIMKFCCIFTNDYCLFFIITSIIINSLVFFSIYKYSRKPIISIFIYLINSSFFLSMNLVRQYISSSLFIISFFLSFDNKKKIKTWICMILACFFHTSAVFFIPIIWIRKKKMNDVLLVVLSVITIFLGRPILQFILNLFSYLDIENLSKYSVYVSQKGNLPFSSLFVEVAVYLYFCYIFSKNIAKIDEKKKAIAYINIQWFVVLFTVACSINELFIRVSSMLTLFQVFSIPYFYYIGKNSYTKDDGNKYKINEFLFLAIITIMIIRIIYSIIIKGSANVLPYKTVFNRPDNIYSQMNYIEYHYNKK